ncbi:FixH family protein [Mesorhizobium sp. M0938]|uniref:FixH family protein n=1 Tax=unclassified Mesorhizobium TaxID=325217 RepID=UPI00333D3AB5
MTVPWPRPSTSSLDGRALPESAGIDGVDPVVMVWKGGLVVTTAASSAFSVGPARPAGDRAAFGAGQFRECSYSQQAVPVAPEQRDTEDNDTKQESRRVHRLAHAGTHPGLFATIIIVNLTMAVLASSWTGFIVENSHVASQEFNRNAQEGRAQAALLGRDRAPPCNRKWRDPLPPPDRNGKTLKPVA